MKLTDKEKNILACIELRSDCSVELVRKETGYQEHVIRYHIKRMIEKGMITSIPFINLHALGFMVFNIFFSVAAPTKAKRLELIKTLAAIDRVVWIGEFSGDYHLGIAVCVRNMHELTRFLDILSKRVSGVFFEKSFSSQYSATMFYRKYLSRKKFSQKSLTSMALPQNRVLDELDDKILRGLNKHRDQSHRFVAQQIGVPLSTFELRLKKMATDKILTGFIYASDPSKFGMHCFKLLIYARGHSSEIAKEFYNFAEKHPNMTYFIESLGSWDYEIGVETERPEDVIDVTQDLYDRFGQALSKVSVLTKFRDLKFSWYPVGV